MSTRIAGLLLLASLINISAMFFYQIGADIPFHSVFMDCFSIQFWQGDLYPRWCFDNNTGLGVPAFLYYFPLPYYIAALLYPLYVGGLSHYAVFIIAFFFATFFTGVTCFLWLKDIVTPRFALLSTLLLLFMPYRMEAMLYRGAYTELWAMVWMPLVFKYTRRVVKGENDIAWLAMAFGLTLLSNVPCAFIVALASGLYVLMMTHKSWNPKFAYACGMLWGGVLAAFYLLPGLYYRQFMAPFDKQSAAKGAHIIPNGFMDMFAVHWIGRIVIFLCLVMAVTAILSAYVTHNRSRIPDIFIRREAVAWAAVFAVCLFLLFPISAPFYDHLGPLAAIVFPWRMQMIFMCCAVFMAAVWMQWLAKPRQRSHMNADMIIFCSLLFLISFLELVDYSKSTELFDNAVAVRFIAEPEYRTQWADSNHFGPQYLMDRFVSKNREKSVVISGKGQAYIRHWAWDGIELHTESNAPFVVRLDHNYFPLWKAQTDMHELVTLRPEEQTGQMLLDIPAGEHNILLTYSVLNGSPYLVIANVLSAMAWLAIVAVYMRRKRFDNLRSAC